MLELCVASEARGVGFGLELVHLTGLLAIRRGCEQVSRRLDSTASAFTHEVNHAEEARSFVAGLGLDQHDPARLSVRISPLSEDAVANFTDAATRRRVQRADLRRVQREQEEMRREVEREQAASRRERTAAVGVALAGMGAGVALGLAAAAIAHARSKRGR